MIAPLLKSWAEAIARLANADATATIAALQIDSLATVGPTWITYATPPVGIASLKFSLREGNLDFLAVDLAVDMGPTRSELVAAFGEPRTLPVLPGNHQLAFRVEGATHACVVLASFAKPPTDDAKPTRLALRRDRKPA